MRILDKYILKAFLAPFLFGVFTFTSIFVGTGTLFRIAQFITEYGASLWSVSRAFVLALPSIVVLTFPMSVLLGSLLAFGKLSGSSELIVMRTGGQSFQQLARPVYILALLISLGTTLFNEYVVPRANHAYQTIVREEIKGQASLPTQNHVLLKQVSGNNIQAIMYASSFNQESKILKGVTVQEFTNGAVSRIETAERAVWNGSDWIMKDGIIHEVNPDGAVQRSLKFKEQSMPIRTNPTQVSAEQRDRDEMTIKELLATIKILKAADKPTAKYYMTIYERFSIPLASFVFALVGACLGMQPQRSSSSKGFGISVIIIFLYYGVMTLTQALGNGGVLPPLIAAFTPDFLGLLAGVYLNYRASS